MDFSFIPIWKPLIFEKKHHMSKYIYGLLFVACLLVNCKPETKKEIVEPQKELNILERIAEANGFGNWKDVKTVAFTFNVDRDTSHFERHWVWNIPNKEVTGISLGDTISYNRMAVDSTLSEVDGAFINDKYWLLAPFNLIWDQPNFTFEHLENTPAPMANEPMQKLTIVYGSEGGYTPGDAYDFYLSEDLLIREWVFRKSNADTPSLITSWENYEEFNGIKIARNHKNPEGSFELYFTNIKVE